jgi:hypothetical protein
MDELGGMHEAISIKIVHRLKNIAVAIKVPNIAVLGSSARIQRL